MTQTIASVPLQLIDSALRAAVLAGIAGIVLAGFRVKSTSLRLAVWRAVLYSALAMPLLAWTLPPVALRVPDFFANTVPRVSSRQIDDPQASVSRVANSLAANEVANREEANGVRNTESTNTINAEGAPRLSDSVNPASSRRSIPWSALVSSIYFVVALLMFSRIVVGIIFGQRLLRRCRKIDAPRVSATLIAQSRSYGMSFIPEAVESDSIPVPLTLGVARSKIVLPADWNDWDDAKLDAILAHELSHVARRDALTQLLSLMHRAVFWFSPLAWWLDRHLADLAEQASDEAALSAGANRNDYARTLLGFFEALHASPGRVWWQGVSMAKTGQAEKRLERILSSKGMFAMNLKKSAIIALFALTIPAVYLTAAIRPASPQNTLAPVGPVAPVAPVAPVVPRNGSISMSPVAALAPVARVSPIAPIAPIQSHDSRSWYRYGYDDEQRFVIVTGNSDSMTMSGTGEDMHHVEKLKKQIAGDFIWFSRDEKSYIIRDQATIARARSLWAPQEELGKRQEALGKQQEELGRQQEALGKKQEEVRVQVPDMTAELDRLKAKLQKIGPTATVEQLGDLQSAIGDLQSKLGDIQSAAGEQQGKLGDAQGALGEKQGKLGEEQGKLGEQQQELARKATREMKELLDEAIKNGTAQPESQSGGGTV